MSGNPSLNSDIRTTLLAQLNVLKQQRTNEDKISQEIWSNHQKSHVHNLSLICQEL